MEKAKKFWNKSAAQFEANDNPNSKVRKDTYEKIRKYLSSNAEVLDFGCATGSLVLEFANEVKSIHGVDISEKMIAIAQHKIDDQQIQNAQLTSENIFNPAFDQRQYDLILAFYVIHLVKTPKETLARLFDLLKPGGILVMEVPCLKEQKGFKAWFTRTFSKLFGLPYLHHFKFSSISEIIASTKFKIVENQHIKKPITRNFITLQK